jgi:hypothetical protein
MSVGSLPAAGATTTASLSLPAGSYTLAWNMQVHPRAPDYFFSCYFDSSIGGIVGGAGSFDTGQNNPTTAVVVDGLGTLVAKSATKLDLWCSSGATSSGSDAIVTLIATAVSSIQNQ